MAVVLLLVFLLVPLGVMCWSLWLGLVSYRILLLVFVLVVAQGRAMTRMLGSLCLCAGRRISGSRQMTWLQLLLPSKVLYI